MRSIISSIGVLLLCAGCAGTPNAELPEIATVESVDLPQFAGRWYVISHIPTFIETEAWNATEDYVLRDDGRIDTTFSFNKGSFDGKRKTYTPVATVRPNTGNAVWGMQFVWPLKAEYRVIWLAEDYSITVIGRSKRDYVWVMAREPSIADAQRQRLLTFLSEQGYELGKLRDVPQQPLSERQ